MKKTLRTLLIATFGAFAIVAATLSMYLTVNFTANADDASATVVSAANGGLIYEMACAEEETATLPEGWVNGYYGSLAAASQSGGNLNINAYELNNGQNTFMFNEYDGKGNYVIDMDFYVRQSLVSNGTTSGGSSFGIIYRAHRENKAIDSVTGTDINRIYLSSYYTDASYSGKSGWNYWFKDPKNNNAAYLNVTRMKTLAPGYVDKFKNGQLINYRLAVIDNEIIFYVDGYEVLRYAHDYSVTPHLASGTFGISAYRVDATVTSYKVYSLDELATSAANGNEVAHGLTLPATASAESSANLSNYTATTTVNFGESENAASVIIAEKNGEKFTANVNKAGEACLKLGATTLYTATATIADANSVNIRTSYANGFVRAWVDGVSIGAAVAENATAKYGFNAAEGVTYANATLNETEKVAQKAKVVSDKLTFKYGDETPDWSGMRISATMSDGSVVETPVTADMVEGYNAYAVGTQTLTVRYTVNGKEYAANIEAEVEKDDFIYIAEFSEERVTGLPDGITEGSYFKGATYYQENGSLFAETYGVSGVKLAYFTDMISTDYYLEVEATVLSYESSGNFGLTYRTAMDEPRAECFFGNAIDRFFDESYYGNESFVDNKSGWHEWGRYNAGVVKSTFPDIYGKYTGGKSMKMWLAVVGDELIMGVDNYELFHRTLDVASYPFLGYGNVGIYISHCNVRIDSFKVKSLASLSGELGEEAIDATTLYDYTAVTKLSLTEGSKAQMTIADGVNLYVGADGAVSVANASKTLCSAEIAVSDLADVTVRTSVSNGFASAWVDENYVGTAWLNGANPRYETKEASGVTYGETKLYKPALKAEKSELICEAEEEIPFGAENPVFEGIYVRYLMSDGSTKTLNITSDMVEGYNPTESGVQYVTVTYPMNDTTISSKVAVKVGDNPKVKLKVGIMSDVHIGANASNVPAMKSALEYYKAKGCDAIVCVGDLGHNYYYMLQDFADVWDSVFPANEEQPERIIVMGNHDTYCLEEQGYKRATAEHNQKIVEVFEDMFHMDSDYGDTGVNYYKVVKGYVFVGLYIQTPIAEREAMIAKAYELPEAQGKPVFVIEHEHPVGTTYITQGANATGAGHDFEMNTILKNYPNAVMLVGHAHNPLADERAIWQGDYTVVTCGSLFGPIVESNRYVGGVENGSFQPNNWSAKSALYMEVTDEDINIVRYDFTNNEKLGKDWNIAIDEDGNLDLTGYNYELRYQSAVAPEFAEDAVVTAEPLSASIVRITFPKAITEYEEMDDIIQSYVIRAFDDQTGELLGEKRVCSQHYLGRVPEKDSYTLNFNGLKSGVTIRFEVTAAESYQKEGKALIVKTSTDEFSIEGKTPDFYSDFTLEWDKDKLDTYTTDTAVKFENNALVMAGNSSSKALVKGLTLVDGTVETLVTATGSSLGAGLHLFASGAADEMDTITSLNVELESDTGSRDLIVRVYRFEGKYVNCPASATISDYFADGNLKGSVALKVEVTNKLMSIFVDGKLALTYVAGKFAVEGSVGFRSHFSDVEFDYLKVYVTGSDYALPDSAEFDSTMSSAKEAIAKVVPLDVENAPCDTYSVPEAIYNKLLKIVMDYDRYIVRAYEVNMTNASQELTKYLQIMEAVKEKGLAHTAGEWEQTLAATCESAGLKHKVCTVCGEELETEEIKPLGHEWGEWTVVKEATATEDGEERRVCLHDETHYETRAIPATGENTSDSTSASKDDEASSSGKKAKLGCKSSLPATAGIIALVSGVAAAFALRKKKRD